VPSWLRRFARDRENRELRIASAVAVAFICLLAVLFFLMVSPASSRKARLTAEHDALRKKYAEAVLFQQQKKGFQGVKAGILTQNDMPLLIKDLVQKARNSGLAVGGVKYEIPAAGTGSLVRVSFSFPAEGSYAGVKRFLYTLETSSRHVGIQDVGLDSDKGRVKLSLKLITYIKGQED
jgi:Tfp pilus assembly protein PilO